MTPITVSGIPVHQTRNAYHYRAGLTIDADGDERAYGPGNKGLDYTANAGHPGNWWGVVTDNGKPVTQGPTDPAPGYYVSTTALEDSRFARTDPRRYVDSDAVPYVVLPPQIAKAIGARLGDFAVVVNLKTWSWTAAIYADIGPRNHLGEASIEVAQRLGLPDSPRNGGTESKLCFYVIFHDSGNGKPRTVQEIDAEGARLFEVWGGIEAVKGLV